MNEKDASWRTLLAFWIFGVGNTFISLAFLSAAKDILNRDNVKKVVKNDTCLETIDTRVCSATSTGVVLICSMIPSLIVRLASPFVSHKFPYGVRHMATCISQIASLLITALAPTVKMALGGILLISFAAGLGETTYLGLTSHYHGKTLVAWAAGSGVAGIAASLSYASMTDLHLIGMSPQQALLSMIVVPVVLAVSYYILLEPVETVVKARLIRPSTWINLNADAFKNKRVDGDSSSNERTTENISITEEPLPTKLQVLWSFKKYMIPLFAVYFAEFFINQGLTELVVFDCAHGFSSSPGAQYRWFQVLYQLGVLISRSTVHLLQLNYVGVVAMPVLQVINMLFIFATAVYSFVPYFWIVAVVIFYEGLLGGGAYVSTFQYIHRKADPRVREFAMSTCTVADAIGITLAAFLSPPAHNWICSMPLYK